MARQYDVDTKLVGFLINICIAFGIFFLMLDGFLMQSESQAVQTIRFILMLLFTLLLGATVGMLVMWLEKYRNSLLTYLRKK
jgi:hypothetical protein